MRGRVFHRSPRGRPARRFQHWGRRRSRIGSPDHRRGRKHARYLVAPTDHAGILGWGKDDVRHDPNVPPSAADGRATRPNPGSRPASGWLDRREILQCHPARLVRIRDPPDRLGDPLEGESQIAAAQIDRQPLHPVAHNQTDHTILDSGESKHCGRKTSRISDVRASRARLEKKIINFPRTYSPLAKFLKTLAGLGDCLLNFVRQGLTQALDAAADACFDSADFLTGLFGDLSLGEAAKIGEFDGLALGGR